MAASSSTGIWWIILASAGGAPVRFTRSRAYRKNDNARVEQKNWTHVRQLVGYGRLEGEQVAELLDELYRKEWSWFRNFFCPVMKHLRTECKGSRKRRIYDQPASTLCAYESLPPSRPIPNRTSGTTRGQA